MVTVFKALDFDPNDGVSALTLTLTQSHTLSLTQVTTKSSFHTRARTQTLHPLKKKDKWSIFFHRAPDPVTVN